MATKKQVELLEDILVNSRFYFIPKGVHNLKDIYNLVKLHYPKLCDDDVKRLDKGRKQIVWKHQVRLALQRMQDKPATKHLNEGKADGIWEFN